MTPGKKRTNYMWTCFLCLLFNAFFIRAQVPGGINYQAIARDPSGLLISNTNVLIQFKIHDGSVGGNVIYAETHNLSTNQFGLFTAVIGKGSVTTGVFSSIDWGNGAKFLEVLIANAGIGTTQLQAVPYALYAAKAGSGASLQSGSGAPANTGNVGDFYIDNSSHMLYGPYSSTNNWGSGTSLIGSPGINGNSILNGKGAPITTLGVANDFYIDTLNKILFGPKTTNWPASGISLIGPPGSFNVAGTDRQTLFYNPQSGKWDANNTFLIDDAIKSAGIDMNPTSLSSLSVKNKPKKIELFFSGTDSTEIVSASVLRLESIDKINYESKLGHNFTTRGKQMVRMDTIGSLIIGNYNRADTGLNIGKSMALNFEGKTFDNNYTRLGVVDPTQANNLQLPNTSGVLLTDPTVSSGDIFYRDLTGIQRLPIGTSGQILGITAGLPTWQNNNPLNLPTGTNFQTIYNNNGTWTATTNLNNNGSNVGIGVVNPTQTLSIGNTSGEKINFNGSTGTISLLDNQATIQFPSITSTLTPKPMITMFEGATTNRTRMVLAHSNLIPNTGLEFNDKADIFNFRNTTDTVLSIGLQTETITYRDNNQGEGKILVSDTKGNAHWKKNSKITSLNIATQGGGLSFSSTASSLPLINSVSFNKTEDATLVEITFQGLIYVQAFSNGANLAYFEIRVDGNSPTNGGVGILHKDLVGLNIFSSFTAIFNNLPAGVHNIQIYGYTDSGNASNANVNKSVFTNAGVLLVDEHY